MKTYFLSIQENDKKEIAFYREWMPLESLNCIALLRTNSIDSWLCTEDLSDTLINNNERARIFVSSSSLDYWQCPKLRITKFIDLCCKLSRYHDVFIFGFHGTLLPEYILNVTGAKSVIRGEPEAIILQICSRIPLDDIKGITFKKGEKIISNPDAPLIDMATMPVPAYDQVSADKYRFGLTGWDKFGVFETSRGCLCNCSFCAKDIMYGNGYRTKNVKQVVNEVCSAVNEHGFRTGYFLDLTFTQDQKRTTDICSGLISKKLNFIWACDTKIDWVNAEMLKIMYQAGCRMIAYGVESYKDVREFVKFKSGFLEKEVIETVSLTESLGINCLCYYQVGRYDLINDNNFREDMKTLKMMLRIPSSYVSTLRFFDFKDKAKFKQAIEGKNKYKKDRLYIAIKIFLLRFYVTLPRIIKFIKNRSIGAIFKDIFFFFNVLINK